MEKVAHFLDLTRNAFSVRKSDGAKYVHLVSGGCAIAIKESCFVGSMLSDQLLFETAESILFITTNSEDFEIVSHCDDYFLVGLSVMDFHDIFFQKWCLKGAHWPLSSVADIRIGIAIERPSDGKACTIVGTYLGKAVLHEVRL